MADIFISYSRQDSEQANLLTELLMSAGLSVWIDRSDIEAASSWSKEIVQAIDGCRAFVVLLSPASNESTNVHKEVSLAAEKKKKILPLDLEPIQLSEDLQYHLAGIQRAPMTNIDAVIRALGKLGLEATQAPSIKLVKETDARKSLMILPFEDFSPTGDNAWFADGIVSEMISALSNIKALRVTDTATTKDFKRYQGTLPNYAKEMGIRYFVSGDVRKFGDNIKITSRLLDIETGDHLWQDSMKGTMEDIFDIQEKVAEKVVEGLKMHLASDEKKKLAERGTENAEAYELYMKASEYLHRQTQEGFQLAIQLLSEAIKLDPDYANAYLYEATALAALYRNYNRDPLLLDEGRRLITEALRLKPDLWWAYNPLSIILQLQGKLDEAEQIAKAYIRNAPEDSRSHFALGFFFMEAGYHDKAVVPFAQSLKLKPESLVALWNIILCYSVAGEEGQVRHWSGIAIPLYEKHLKLFPDDENKQVRHAGLLLFAGRHDEARDATRRLENLRDGNSLYNVACLQCELAEFESALKTFRKAIEAGFRQTSLLNQCLYDDGNGGLGKLKGTPEWEEVRAMVEKIEPESAAGS